MGRERDDLFADSSLGNSRHDSMDDDKSKSKKPPCLDGVRTAIVYSGRAALGIGAFSREQDS